MKYLLPIIIFLLLHTGLFARNVSGTINTPVTWNGEMHLTGDILLTTGGVITVLPGTTVKADGFYVIQVEGTGRILARGTEAQPILFTANDTNGFDRDLLRTSYVGAWKGIRFGSEIHVANVPAPYSMSSSADSSIFEYCTIQYSKSYYVNNRDQDGGGMYAYQTKLRLSYCTFKHNFAASDGGGGFFRNVLLIHCIFTNNTALMGAAFIAKNSTLIHCTSTHNNAGEPFGIGAGAGGMIKQSNIIGSFFAHNISTSSLPFGGGGMYVTNSHIINCIIINNTGSVAGGVSLGGTNSFYNTIIRGNIGPAGQSQIQLSNGTTRFYHCNIEGGNSFGAATYQNCIDVDPMFLDPATGNYAFQLGSPCINTGSITGISHLLPAVDWRGAPRINGIIDMGTHENVNPSKGVALYEYGTPVPYFEIYPRIITDSNGKYTVNRNRTDIFGKPYIEVDTAPEGFGFHPRQIYYDDSFTTNIAYKGIVVDTPYIENSTVTWNTDTANVFIDINLHNIDLNIEKCAKVEFYGYYGIDVSGTGSITASGTDSFPILFTVDDKQGFVQSPTDSTIKGAWRGITFDNLTP